MNGTEYTIGTKKAPIFIRIFLILIMSILILIPITVIALTYGNGPHIGILVSFIICWGVGFYLLKIVLWNTIGQEILTVNREKISYIADFGFFKDGRKEIEIDNLETEIIYTDHNKQFGRLILKNKSTYIETVLQAKIMKLEEIRNEIKTLHKKL
ncbi:hypothetical protein [Marinilabilia rubra]|uniref:DUF304 domain-containing protein n=1 Tax=Marinilabilia rubra TaxID=2162893 RepID=A0A2U2B332_9BACT|nr:hypothetical protein [Marinilabilia rubra]PWD97476.1 hypothetical protein DDZ16_20565 [Marinilabilia rubra]